MLSITIICISLITTIISTLVYYDKIKQINKEKNGWLLACAVVSIICMTFLLNSSKIFSEIKNLFFKGSLVKTKVFVEGDGEIVDHYEDVLKFYPAVGVSKTSLEIIQFLILLFLIGGFGYCFNLWRIHSREEKGETIESSTGNYLIIIKIITATILLVCLLNMPYGYYEVVRLLVSIGCIYIAARQARTENLFTWLFFVAIAILFNPIWEIHFTRLIWNVIDIAVAVILLTSAGKEYVDSRY